ncbi:site-specific integrase [Novosphingobium sp. PP1Y]|uniref:site-specific integrase n=1 Tax=Novosphingobium sp. PP1Y TaxID=702113 RepID=UPI000A058D2D
MPESPSSASKKAFQAASERSGVHATPYTLRHTGADRAVEAGVSMAELAQFMGDDDDRTTQKHYARFSPEHFSGVANAIRCRP